MAIDLPGLPGELLIKIVESAPNYQQRYLHEKLRATCKELNFKLMRSYGSRFFGTVSVRLNQAGMSKLLAISKGGLAFHVGTVTVETCTLINQHDFNPDSESSDFDSYSWYGSDQQDCYAFTKLSFDEGTLQFLTDGTCGDLLGHALAGLPNLKQFYVQQPGISEGMQDRKITQLKARWAVTVRTLFSIVLAKAVPLEVIVFRKYGVNVPADVSALDAVAVFSKQLSRLKKFHLDVSLNNDEANLPGYVRILNSVLTVSPTLTDFGIGFGGPEYFDRNLGETHPKSYTFFKQMAMTFPQTIIRRLMLSHLATRRKYVKMILRACRTTLKALTLDSISWASDDDRIARFLVDEMNLTEATLRCLNEGSRGVFFDRIAYQRPQWREGYISSEVEQEGWVEVYKNCMPQHKLELKADEGDDIKYWLEKVALDCHRWGERWNWDFTG